MMNQPRRPGEIFKKTIILLVLIFHGFATKSLGADGEKYQIWQDDKPREHALYMKNIAPEFAGLVDYWRVKKLPEFGEKVYKIIGFPGQNGKDGLPRGYNAYRPKFSADYKIDSLILTRSGRSNFLDEWWTPRGCSCHIILARDGTAFIHANPLRGERGEMAGPEWNDRSLEVAFIDGGNYILNLDYILNYIFSNYNLSPSQQTALENLLGIFEKKSAHIEVVRGGSIWEAKQLLEANLESRFKLGRVSNIEEVRQSLNLSPLTLR